MKSWLEAQKEILQEQEFIAEVDVKTITLTRFGGYKATPYGLDFKLISEPNAKSLKGVWRWWARLAIIGAFNGRIDYKKADEYLNKIFGGTKEHEGISTFKLQVSDIKFPEDYDNKLMKLHNVIDEFYKNTKEFLISEEPKLKEKLPKNIAVTVSLNPYDLSITIKHERENLIQYKNFVNNLISQGSLKDYFCSLSYGSKGKRLIVTLRFPKDKLEPEMFHRLNEYLKIPRIRILLMPRVGEKNRLQSSDIDSNEIMRYLERIKEEMTVLVSEGLEFKILVYGSGESEKINFALSSLLLSLILGGIGSMTKRAFGSLKLISFRFKDDLKIDFKILKMFEYFKTKNFTKEEIKGALEDLCDSTIVYAKNLFKSEETLEIKQVTFVPSLSNIKIEVIECPSCDLAKIGNAFLKQTWKLKPMEQGRDIHTWILGLPRWQQNTGYAVKVRHNHKEDYDAKRRISSIGARCFRTKDKNFIILFGLLSQDWPIESLLHVSGRRQPMPIKNIRIRQRPKVTGASLKDVFDTAFAEVSKKVC